VNSSGSMKIHSFNAGIANVHLIDDGRGVVVVDAGWRGFASRILRQVRRLGYQPRDVRLILLTHVHVDHAGSAAELRRLTGAPIAAHRGDAHIALAGRHTMPLGRGWAGVSSKWLVEKSGVELKFEAFTPDIWLEQGQTLGDFGLEGYVVHTPGHTRGSVTLALEDGITLIGDALINLIKVGYPMYWEDPERARESGRKIQGLKPRVLYSGHGRAFSGAQLDHYLEAYAAKKAR
jgi:glyoxylase-like metal-dependent hydrolase (beta-lactamase superfamily II)